MIHSPHVQPRRLVLASSEGGHDPWVQGIGDLADEVEADVVRLDAHGFPTWARLRWELWAEGGGDELLRTRWPRARTLAIDSDRRDGKRVEVLVVNDDYVAPGGGGYPHFIGASEIGVSLDGTLLREVAQGLYVGSAQSVHRPPAGGWRAVVQLALACPQVDPEVPGDVVLRAPFEDGCEPDAPTLRHVLRTIYRVGGHPYARVGAPRAVLVQCQAGISRSASLAYAALRALWWLPHEEALRRVRLARLGERWPSPIVLGACQHWADGRREPAW